MCVCIMASVAGLAVLGWRMGEKRREGERRQKLELILICYILWGMD